VNYTARRETTPTPSEWEWHQRALLRLRHTFARKQNSAEALFRMAQERGGHDLIDLTNDRVPRDVLLAEHAVHEHALSEMDAALDRIARRTYGVCEDTGAPIEPARLRTLPWTRFCLAAAAARENAVTKKNSKSKL
jgi:DnaK suppressor protein